MTQDITLDYRFITCCTIWHSTGKAVETGSGVPAGRLTSSYPPDALPSRRPTI